MIRVPATFVLWVGLEVCLDTALQSLRMPTRHVNYICAEIFHMNVIHCKT